MIGNPISLAYNNLVNEPTLTDVLKTFENRLGANLNCIKVGIIEEFDYEQNLAKVLIANKRTIGLNKDGTQITTDYPPIFARLIHIGWGNIGITHPVNAGMECLVFFNDREIESWSLTGEVQQLAYLRTHDLTDAFCIVGVESLPNMTTIDDLLSIFYGNSSITLSDTELNINASTININGQLIINGVPYLNHIHSNGNAGNNTGGVVQ